MSFFDLNHWLRFWAHLTAFQLARDAVNGYWDKPFSLSSWICSRLTSFKFTSIATRATVTSKIFPAGISSLLWPLLSSPLAKVSATSKRA